jgi:hypothetical protein
MVNDGLAAPSEVIFTAITVPDTLTVGQQL